MQFGKVIEQFVKSYTGQVDHANSSTADTVVTGIGFAPRAMVMTAADSSGGHQCAAWGSAGESGANYQGTGMVYNRAGVSGQSFRWGAVGGYESATNYVSGAITFDSDGFTIAWTKTGTPTDTQRIGYTLLR